MKTLIQNVTIVSPTEKFLGDILFEASILEFSRFPERLSHDRAEKVIDGTGKWLLPALIDPHVHFRDPGFTYKEDFHTGTAAAAAGGVGTIFDMPNTNPPTFTPAILQEKRDIVSAKALVNYGLYFGAGPENSAEISAAQNIPGVKMYLNTTTGNLKMDNEDRWREVFNLGRKVSLHAEGETFARAIEIWIEAGIPCELHLCHCSLRSEIELIRDLKTQEKFRGKISVEVCPHHLLMTGKERRKYGAFCCMKPPLATQDDVDALWEGIEDGTVDMLATDHAPHTKEEKLASDLDKNPVYGIPGLETLFSLMFDQFVKRGFSAEKFVRMSSAAAVEIFHIEDKKGDIKPDFDADLILVDPEIVHEISAENAKSKCDWTPFAGRKVIGKVEKTFIRGTEIYDGEKITDRDFRGREVRFAD